MKIVENVKSKVNRGIVIFLVLSGFQNCILYDTINFGYVNIRHRPIVDIEVRQENILGSDIRVFQGTPVWEIAKAIFFYEYFRLDSLIKEKKAYINYQNSKNGGTVLGYAVAKNRKLAVKILLENGADPNVHYKEDDSALHVAVGHSDIEIVKLLLKHGAKVKDEKKIWGRDLLVHAIDKKCDREIVELLVDSGAEIKKGMAYAIKYEWFNYIEYFLEKGYDVNTPLMEHQKWYTIRDQMRLWDFPLNSDMYKNKMEIVKLLKERGMDYYKAPVPIHTDNLIRRYPDTWEEYLEKY